MGNGYAKAYDDEYKDNSRNDRVEYWSHDYKNSALPKGPKIAFWFDILNDKVCFSINEIQGDNIHIVDRNKFEKMIRELKIASPQQIFDRIKEVCDWYILQSQYVQFEEVKNGS